MPCQTARLSLYPQIVKMAAGPRSAARFQAPSQPADSPMFPGYEIDRINIALPRTSRFMKSAAVPRPTQNCFSLQTARAGWVPNQSPHSEI